MDSKVIERVGKFLKSKPDYSSFCRELIGVDVDAILWPEQSAHKWPEGYYVTCGRKKILYPLFGYELKVRFFGEKIDSISREESAWQHPALLLRSIFLFEMELEEAIAAAKAAAQGGVDSSGKSEAKKSSKRAAKKSAAVPATGGAQRSRHVEELSSLQRALRSLRQQKKKLGIDAEVLRRIRYREDLEEYLAERLRESSAGLVETERRLRLIEEEKASAEITDPRLPDYEEYSDLLEENEELRVKLGREVLRCETLEREVSRLAEQIIHHAPIREGLSSVEEYEQLRREYALLHQRYDTLVSQNIDLTNRLEKMSAARSLEEILDLVRDRINTALRTGVAGNPEGDAVLLRSITNELSQLQRARTYLARALFDMGILYLRLEQRDKAVVEFRAARELGIEDPEINRIIDG